MIEKIRLHCKSCSLYRVDDDDIGTCLLTDNITQEDQDACNDYNDINNKDYE